MFVSPSKLSLIGTPEAENFMQQAGMKVGRKVMFGDREKLHGRAHNAIGEADGALEQGAKTIANLIVDETRQHNPVLQHEAVKAVAGRTITVLERSQASIAKTGEELKAEGLAKIEAALKQLPGRERVYDETLRFIQRNAQEPDGFAKICATMNDYSDVVKVPHDMPPYLLGLSPDAWANMYEAGVKRHAPEGNQLYEAGKELTIVAAKYDKAIAGIKGSFYTAALADKAHTRVEV